MCVQCYLSPKGEGNGKKKKKERIISISCFKILHFIHANKFLQFCGEKRQARRATERITLPESTFLKNLKQDWCEIITTEYELY